MFVLKITDPVTLKNRFFRTSMDSPVNLTQSKLTFISTVNRYLREQHEGFHILCKVIIFFLFKKISIRNSNQQNPKSLFPQTSLTSHIKHALSTKIWDLLLSHFK